MKVKFMSDVGKTIGNVPHLAQGGAAEPEDAHYSDQTLAALVKCHGWRYRDVKQPQNGVERLFDGLAHDGMVVPDGARYLLANYSEDPERRRYIALYAGWELLGDWDGRNGSPEDIASRLNERAEHYVQLERVRPEAA
ncbi:hypothetical protein DY926_16455 [Komagataeibacter melaceti]|uniref:Uncharacterized protein n=2 Tax=Komagataeibacter melaceti TaxID=2766577 RepID=A0A371YW52_9PROT|nr:hypothetical protein DY926_16455 [Komagataeibacter melaceti]